jgi:hypothetical protein
VAQSEPNEKSMIDSIKRSGNDLSLKKLEVTVDVPTRPFITCNLRNVDANYPHFFEACSLFGTAICWQIRPWYRRPMFVAGQFPISLLCILLKGIRMFRGVICLKVYRFFRFTLRPVVRQKWKIYHAINLKSVPQSLEQIQNA